MPNVLEEEEYRNKKEEFRLRQRLGRSSEVLECGSSKVEEVEERKI